MITEINQIIQKQKDGDIAVLDAVIELNRLKKEAECSIEAIKSFFYENMEAIEINAKEYQNKYMGCSFSFVSGKKIFNFKNIPEWLEKSKQVKDVEEKAVLAWELAQKGDISVSKDGEISSLPEVSYSKGYFVIKEKKNVL